MDPHTRHSEDEIPEILKAPRNLYFEAQQKPESYFREGIFVKDWLSNPSPELEAATDDSEAAAPSTMGTTRSPQVTPGGINTIPPGPQDPVSTSITLIA